MMDTEEFYRIFGVFDSGGTLTDGQMLDAVDVPDRIASWIKKNTDLRCISIVKVTKHYPMERNPNND